MTTRAEVIAAAETWLSVPYKDKGRNRFGIDCVGLVILVANETGLSDYDTINYPRRPNSHDFLREMKGHLSRKPKDAALPGDIMMFRGPRIPCHLGILDACGNVIHAYMPHKKVTRDPLIVHMDLAVCAWQYEGLED